VYTLGFTNNTGDTVHHIVMMDTLNALLDAGTVQMLGASHAYNAQLVGGNVLKITMGGLNLLPGAKGYASFAVKPVTTLVPGTPIPNSAAVIFGGIPSAQMSVVVNNPDTTVTNGVNASPVVSDELKLFPVPANEEVELQAATAMWANATFEVMDARGARMMSGRLSAGRARWSVQSWAPGLYIVRAQADGRVVVRKLVVR
jgi:hypothetical protein